MSKKENIFGSFGYALSGVGRAFKSEPNFRIHTIAAILALTSAYLFKFSTTEWLILIFAISIVLILELINTAIETTVDMISPRYSIKAKVIKDVSAAAVMISAILAVIVGALLFLPRILQMFQVN